MTFTPRSARTLPMRRPTADPAAREHCDNTGTRFRGKGVVRRTDHCEGRDRVDQHLRANFVRNRVRQRHQGAGRNDDLIVQAPGAGKTAALPLFQPESRIDLGADLADTMPAPSNPGTRPSGAIAGGAPNAGEPMMPRQSPGWIGAYEQADANLIWPSDVEGPSSTTKHRAVLRVRSGRFFSCELTIGSSTGRRSAACARARRSPRRSRWSAPGARVVPVSPMPPGASPL